jgi:hypothetical protein
MNYESIDQIDDATQNAIEPLLRSGDSGPAETADP